MVTKCDDVSDDSDDDDDDSSEVLVMISISSVLYVNC